MNIPARPRHPRWGLGLVIAFLLLLLVLGWGLKLKPRELPSPLISRVAPDFSLPVLAASGQSQQVFFSPQQLRGQVWLLNVWASWCVSCRYEHPVLVEFAQSAGVPIVGLNYKELLNDDAAGAILQSQAQTPAQQRARQALTQRAMQRARQWLAQYGNPYTLSVLDLDGRVGIDYGVYGVPETYVIDKAGVIRFKFTGPLDAQSLARDIVPLIRQLQS